MGLRSFSVALTLASALVVSSAVANVIRQPAATFEFPGSPPLFLSNDQGTPTQNPSVGILVYPKNGVLCSLSTGGVENCTGGVGGSGYTTLQNNGVSLTQRTTANFVNSGCVDNAGALRTDCTFGTVTSVGSGTGLTGGPITGSGSLALSTPVAIANGGTNGATALAGFNNLSPLTTTGDLLTFSGGNNVRLPIGSNGQVLTLTAGAPGWATPAAGGTVTSITQGTGITATPNPITGAGTIALTVPVVTANGGTGLTSENDNTVLFGQGANPLIAGAVSSCSAGNNALSYTTGSHALTCNTGLMQNFTVAGTSGSNVTISNGSTLTLGTTNSLNIFGSAPSNETFSLKSPVCTAKGSALNYNNGTDTLSCQGNVGGYTRVDSFSGVDCTGATSSRTGLQTAINSLANTGQTLFIPSGCLLGLDSPGVGINNAAITLANNIHILCADQSAGFFALRQFCSGGTYPNAHCNVNSDCQGGGTCVSSFGASANPPTSAQQFANTAGTHWMFRDAGVLSSDVNIENCSFYAYQADPYQSCSGGTSTTLACRQECDNASTTPGLRCETSADCGAGVCLRVADCHTGGGTCGGAPGKPSGTNPINVLDLSNTSNASIEGVSVFDHFNGDFAIKTGPHGTFRRDNFAREFTDGTSPIPTVPSSSTCFTTQAGECNYGAFNGATSNVQPTTSVTNDVSVGNDSQLLRVSARGTTAAMTGTMRSRIDESTVEPHDANGPGTPSAGYAVTSLGIVAKSYAEWLANNVTGINLNGNDSTAIENKLLFATGNTSGTGIAMSASNGHATGNNIKGLAGSSVGIKMVTGSTSNDAKTNYIENGGTTGIGIEMTGANGTATGNQIVSAPANTLQAGIKTDGGSQGNNIIDGNIVSNPTKACFWVNNLISTGQRIENNVCIETPPNASTPQSGATPICLVHDGAFAQQTTFNGNLCFGFWRGITGSSFTNVNVVGNRFFQFTGAPLAAGNAGVNVIGNYFNANNTGAPSTWTMSCDSSCAGGSPVSRGLLCLQDSDCTANGNTCNAGTVPCSPEPMQGYLGDPLGNVPDVHPTWASNLMFNAMAAPLKQCTGAGNIGQQCTVSAANGSCAGGATCSGGPPTTCQSGADAGLLCCTTGGTGTCGIRVKTPHLIVPDYGAAQTAITNGMINNNQIFGGSGADGYVGIDMVRGGSLGNIKIVNMNITGNQFADSGGSTTVAINLPTTFAQMSGVNITDNLFSAAVAGGTMSTLGISNYVGSMGSLLLQNGTMTLTDFNLTTGAQTVFSGLGKNNTTPTLAVATGAAPVPATAWSMRCVVSSAPSNTSTRTFSLLRNGGVTLSCQIANAATACSATQGPTAFVGGEQVAVQQISVVGGTLAAANATCSIYFSSDAQ